MPGGVPQRARAASGHRQVAGLTGAARVLLFLSLRYPFLHRGQLAGGTHLLTARDLEFFGLHMHRVCSLPNCLPPPPFSPSLLPTPPLTHKPRGGMTKEPHSMALPLMEKNELDASAEAGIKHGRDGKGDGRVHTVDTEKAKPDGAGCCRWG